MRGPRVNPGPADRRRPIVSGRTGPGPGRAGGRLAGLGLAALLGLALAALPAFGQELLQVEPEFGDEEPAAGTTGQSDLPTLTTTPNAAETLPLGGLPSTPTTMTRLAGSSRGALLRGLDKMAGATGDLELSDGQTGTFGNLSVTLSECRYPQDDPASDAWAHLSIKDHAGQMLFNGWMIASSPALSALDDPRYDIWVIRCSNS